MNTIEVVRKTIVEDTRAIVTPLHVLTSVDMCVYNTEHTDQELSISTQWRKKMILTGGTDAL